DAGSRNTTRPGNRRHRRGRWCVCTRSAPARMGGAAVTVQRAGAGGSTVQKGGAGAMHIRDIQVHVVNVPLTVPFTSSLGTRAGTTRTVVQVRTDTGLDGLGESLRGQPTAALVERHKHLLIGEDPFELERIRAK